jgi:hypothetical protein
MWTIPLQGIFIQRDGCGACSAKEALIVLYLVVVFVRGVADLTGKGL